MKAKRIRFSAIAALIALLSLVLFVAACSDDDDDDASPTATEAAVEEPTDEPAGSETTVDVARSSSWRRLKTQLRQAR